ncbi:MAG TPA: sialidase family protein [Actinomycetota bacterium]|nr:sialidase family protein [Actinomycetota bacterium]
MAAIRSVRGKKAAAAAVGILLVFAAVRAGDPATASSITATVTSGGDTVAHSNGKALPYKGKQKALFYRVGLPAGEPTIAISRRGDLFFPSIDVSSSPPNHVEVLKSADEGKTWTIVSPKIGPANRHPVSLDPYVWVDPATDRIYNIDLTVACSLMSFTDDRGETWTTNPLACGRPVNDHQTLFGGPPSVSPTVGYPSVIYYCWNDVGSSSCSKSLDGGLTFTPTGSPSFTGVQPSAASENSQVPFCGGLHGHGVVGDDGTVYVPKESCLQPWLAISKDEGATWENVKVSNISAGDGILDPSVDVDKKGNIYYTWTGGDRRVYFTTSTDGGATWSKATVVTPPGVHEANLATLDVGGVGKVAIAFMGSENSPWRHNCAKKDKCPESSEYDKTTWNGYVTTTTNALDGQPTFVSTAVNPPKDPITRGRCGPGRCGLVFDFIDVGIAPDGSAYATFVDACVAICADKNGASNYGSDGVVVHIVGGSRLK